VRVLVVEDEVELLDAIVEGLRDNYFTVDAAVDGDEALHKVRIEESYDVIVLDIMLPKMDGISLLRMLRSEGYKMAVLMLTARDNITDKVQSLDSGADDYLTKPFDFRELLARIRALLRREKEDKVTVLGARDLELDVRTHSVRRANRPIDLTRKEYQILEYLLLYKGRVVEKAELERHLWGEEASLWSDTLRTHMKNLRKKIDSGKEASIITTISGTGYEVENDL
jgi:DNA-binding response OmpR family regulator